MHLRNLKHRTHSNKHLQRVCDKHGIEGFKFKILQKYKPEYCLEAEEYWITYLNTYNKGYNQSKTAKGCSTSFEVKRKMSTGWQKQILQIDKSSNIVNKFSGIVEAGRQTGINKTDISFCCNKNNKVKMAGGYLWCFENEYTKDLKYCSNYHNGHIIQYDKIGNVIKEWSSIQEASNAYANGHNGNISNCCKGKIKGVYGFVWKYKE